MIRRLNGIKKLFIVWTHHRPHSLSVFHKYFHRFQKCRITRRLLFPNPSILISIKLSIADHLICCACLQRVLAMQSPGIDPVHLLRESCVGLLLLRKGPLCSPAVLPDYLTLLIPVQILQV